MLRPVPTVVRTDLVICYDVDTVSEGGKRRLRRVAKACEAYGQRVQFSVFECSVTPNDWERLQQRLLDIIDPELDSLRVYTLRGPRDQVVRVFGRDGRIDFEGPLIQ
ncbi:MAG TPA: CRISPR-associated endonuclease Cas2 [Armatimonadetes bacterium]|nr:CRISPR-associated endonuclease Cas2 [Armatimonadota bacterium]HCE01287.1 CRISPR-associated endonuclease Cas2 [Armatimonadota bacterium]